MLAEQSRGSQNCTKKSTGFTGPEWTSIAKDVAERTGTNRYNKDRLKGKNKRLKYLFKKFRDLLRQSGFGWDKELGTVTVDDAVWENYIQKCPEAAKFREKGLPHFELLKELYSNSVASGELNRASSRGAPDSDDDRDMHMSISQGQRGASSGFRKRKSQECDSVAAEKAKKGQLFETLDKYFQSRLEAQGAGAQSQESNEDPYSIQKAMSLLNEFLDTIPPTAYLTVSDMLTMNRDLREQWLSIHPAARFSWLVNKFQ